MAEFPVQDNVTSGAIPVLYRYDTGRDLMLGFCSLGDNCEFAFAQKKLGAEPLDLLGWANTPTNILLKLLRSRFIDIGDPYQLKVYTSSVGEYFVKHTGYDFAWHAFERIGPDGNPTATQIRDKAAKRMTFLSQKLIRDLKDANKIFVVKFIVDMTKENALEVVDAIHTYGPSTLMYATQGSPIGVSRESDHLLHATLPKFVDRARVPEVLENEWLEICKIARRMKPE
jgi:hypothetical protein